MCITTHLRAELTVRAPLQVCQPAAPSWSFEPFTWPTLSINNERECVYVLSGRCMSLWHRWQKRRVKEGTLNKRGIRNRSITFFIDILAVLSISLCSQCDLSLPSNTTENDEFSNIYWWGRELFKSWSHINAYVIHMEIVVDFFVVRRRKVVQRQQLFLD